MADPGHDDVIRPRVRGAPILARQDRDRRPARRLRAAMRRSHDLAEAARDDRAAALREQAADLFGRILPLRAAPDHRDLTRHRGKHDPWSDARHAAARSSSAAASPAATSRGS